MNERIGSRAVAWRGVGRSPAKKFSIFWLVSKHFAAYAYAEVFEGASAYTEVSEREHALRIPPPWSSKATVVIAPCGHQFTFNLFAEMCWWVTARSSLCQITEHTSTKRVKPLHSISSKPSFEIHAGLPAIRQSVLFGGRMDSSFVTPTLLPSEQTQRQLCQAKEARPRFGGCNSHRTSESAWSACSRHTCSRPSALRRALGEGLGPWWGR